MKKFQILPHLHCHISQLIGLGLAIVEEHSIWMFLVFLIQRNKGVLDMRDQFRAPYLLVLCPFFIAAMVAMNSLGGIYWTESVLLVTLELMKTSNTGKPGLIPATVCLAVLFLIYTVVFCIFPLLMSLDHPDERYSMNWILLFVCGFVAGPVYIYIFNRVYNRLSGLDLFCSGLPLLTWLCLSLVDDHATGRPFPLKNPLAWTVAASYFLVVPLSRRYPGVSRTAISVALFGVTMIGVILIVHYVPA